MNVFERYLIDQKNVRNATYLGEMSAHHSVGASPDKFPVAEKYKMLCNIYC